MEKWWIWIVVSVLAIALFGSFSSYAFIKTQDVMELTK